MTRIRYDDKSTEFGLWLRGGMPCQLINVDIIESRTKSYTTTNVDYVWQNYGSGNYMFIEEKRHNSDLRYAQIKQMKNICGNIKDDIYYKGFYVIIFENTNPEDGIIWLRKLHPNTRNLPYYCLKKHEITVDELLEFLQFKNLEKYSNEKS